MIGRYHLKIMSNIGLKRKYLTGQGYNGASSLSSRYNGVQKYIRDEHPGALYLHCTYQHVVVSSRSSNSTDQSNDQTHDSRRDR